jgi:hypothetical protein
MRSVILAFGFLVVGTCIGFFLGSRSAGLCTVFAASPTPQNQLTVSNAKPRVRGIAKSFRGDEFRGQTLQLDGMEFIDATFQGVTFTYSGGAYSFRNVTFSLPLTVRLEGPAANTSELINLIRSLNSGERRLSPSTGVPVVRETGTRKTVRKVTFAGPYLR